MVRSLFGSGAAQDDDLLAECRVNHASYAAKKPIITGRWGSGKTACFLIDNKELSQILKNVDDQFERAWYLNEGSLDTVVLTDLFLKEERKRFKHSCERLWQAEIVRRAVFLLGILTDHYKVGSGPHWRFVEKAKKAHSVAEPVWTQLPNALKILASFDEARAHSVEELQGHFEDLFTRKARESVQQCLKDVQNHSVQPVIAIEPIDTPTSVLEAPPGLAQAVITSLLNVFVSDYLPSSRQLLRVTLAIPWHRYVIDEITFPQRLPEHKAYLQWSADELASFINSRIEWELRRVHRPRMPKRSQEAWATLFEPQVRNEHCHPVFLEKSFDYTLRHTHHRPRDIQKIARLAVELACDVIKRSPDDILRGTGGLRVDGKYLLNAVRTSAVETTELLITEAGRRFPDLRKLVDVLGGMPTPFSTNQLEDQVKRRKLEIGLWKAVDMLWHAGILGVEVVPASPDRVLTLKNVLPERAHKVDTNVDGKTFHRWYFFAYNWEGEAAELLERYAESAETSARCVLHPITYEKLQPIVSPKWPIGI